MSRVMVAAWIAMVALTLCWCAPLRAETGSEQVGTEQAMADLAVAESMIDSRGLNFPEGRWGTSINGQSFQIEAVTTFNGWQYAAWFNADRHPCVSRRRLPCGAWEHVVFDDHRIDHADVHNVAVLGVCPGDGTIHVAYDHHVHPLRYRVSRKGVATDPEQVRWDIGLFSGQTDALEPGEPLERVTYPAFVPTPDGKLQLYYRIGHSGDGDSHLAEYDPAAGRWTTLGPFVSGRGEYEGHASRCAYHNGFSYGPDGRLHTTWVWRERGGNLLKNHDLMYAWSDDAGRSWRNTAGNVIGSAGGDDVIHLGSPGATVHPIRFDWGLMNQVTQAVDGQGRVHVVLWHNPPDAPGPSDDLNDWRYFHYRREADGTWHRQRLPFFGRKPSLLAGENGDLVLVFTKGEDLRYHGRDPGGELYVARASAASGWRDWQVVHRAARRYVGEARVDRERWRKEGVLSVYAQEHPKAWGDPSPLWVVDVSGP